MLCSRFSMPESILSIVFQSATKEPYLECSLKKKKQKTVQDKCKSSKQED